MVRKPSSSRHRFAPPLSIASSGFRVYSFRSRYAVEAVRYVMSKEIQMIEGMLLVIIPWSHIQKSYLIIMAMPSNSSTDGRACSSGERRYCRKHGIDPRSLITSPPSTPRLPHPSTPLNVSSTSSRRLSVRPIGSQMVFGTCIPFEKR